MNSTEPTEGAQEQGSSTSLSTGLVGGLILVGLSVVLTAAMLELGVRLVMPAYHPGGHNRWHEGDEERPRLGLAGETVSLSHKAGDFDTTVTYNDAGFRERRSISESTGDDLFVVGDSYSFGYGVEADERYSNLLEKALGREVFNICIPEDLEGYGKLVRYAEGQGATIRQLVVGVCMENDLRDYAVPRPRAGKAPTFSKHGLKVLLNAHSALYRYVTTQLNQAPALRGVAVKLGLAGSYDQGIGAVALPEPVVASSVAELKKLTDTRPSTVVIIPARSLWAGANQDVASENHARFVGALRQAGIDVVDLRAHFEATGQPLGLHFKHDGHWTRDGHRLAAEVLASHLKARR